MDAGSVQSERGQLGTWSGPRPLGRGPLGPSGHVHCKSLRAGLDPVAGRMGSRLWRTTGVIPFAIPRLSALVSRLPRTLPVSPLGAAADLRSA